MIIYIPFAISYLSTYLVFLDFLKRGQHAIYWLILVLIFPFITLLLYDNIKFKNKKETFKAFIKIPNPWKTISIVIYLLYFYYFFIIVFRNN